MSTSGLYGNNPAPEVSGANTTSLYGANGSAVPSGAGNPVVRGNLTVTGNLTVQQDATIDGGLTVGEDICVEGDTITLNCGGAGPANAQIVAYRGGGSNTAATLTWDESVPVPPGSEPSGRWVFNTGVNAEGIQAGLVNISPNLNDNLITTYAGSGVDLQINADTDRVEFLADELGLAQGTVIDYSENNDRANRPVIRSTTGNTSGLRVEAPNATTSAVATISAFSTNDSDNGKFLSIQARGDLTTPLRIQSGEYTAGVLSPTGDSVTFIDGGTTYATVNPAGVINSTDLATKAYVDAQEQDTTYTIDASSTTGGANFNLVGSDSTTDTIKFSGSGGTTVTRTSANEITVSSTAGTTYDIDATSTTGGANLNLNGSDSSVDTVKISGGTNITVTATSATEITIDGTDLNTTYTIDASSTTGGANFNLVGSDSTTDTIKLSGSGATTVSQTSANEITISSVDSDTTYTIDAASTTGGANLNLVGSDSTTDTVKFSGSGATTVTQTSANEITISSVDNDTTYTVDATSTTGGANLNLVGSDSTTDTVAYLGSGATTVTRTDANTITISSVDNDTTYTIDASSTTGGANLNLVGSDSTTDTVKFSGSGATTVTQTSANEVTVSSTDTNTTYTQDVSATTGGANLNLVGSDSTTDTVKFANGTGVTVAETDASTMTISIGQAVGTGDSPSFAGVTGGNISVGVATDNTIASTDTNGNITLDPNGTGVIIFDSIQRLRGESQATTNNSYTFPPNLLSTITDNNGYSAASSFAANTNGYPANAQYVHYTADTLAAGNAVAAMNFKQANGNSVAGETIPWTGLTSVAPSASTSSDVLGTINYNGYATTGFTNDIATQYQGGGIGTSHIIQMQGYPTETPVEGTVTLTSANITAVASSFRATMTSPSVVGTKGQIKWTGTVGGIGQAVRVTGTLTGTATGIVSGNNYYIIAYSNDGTFSYATLAATPNGNPIDTTAGTLTGLSLIRCGVTFTLSGQTVYPFGRNALVTVSNVTNVTNGTYPVAGAVSSLTSITLGIPHTTAPTLPGTQQFTCASITSAGGGLRVRAFPNATIMNPANRLTIFDTSAAATTIRSDTVGFYKGTYGGTGAALTSADITYTRTYGEFCYVGGTITPAATNTIYAFPLDTTNAASGTSISNTSRINVSVSGYYKIIMSLQVSQTVNSVASMDFWLRKNGTDVANSATQVDLLKDQKAVIAMDWLVNSNGTDYWEIVYAVNDTNLTFPYSAASASPYVRPAIPPLIVNVIPAGM